MIRIIVVDDFEEWRKIIRQSLQSRADLKIIRECETGAAAIRESSKEKPDLVLLDIGLPDLSGVEVARRISEFSPDSTIIFVTLNDDAEAANGLLKDRAHGYLLKTDLHSELLPAVSQVIANERFISQRLRN